MSVIQIRVDDQQIALTNMPVIASGGIEENQIEFDFSSDWAGFACVACFYRENKSYTSLVSATGVASVPNEVVATDGKMWLGVMGVKDGVTKTSELVFYKILEGAMTQDFDPGEPTPDIYNQILDYVSQVVERDQRLVAVENKASTNASNIATNASNIVIETSERTSADSVINARIDNLIANQTQESVTTLLTDRIINAGSHTLPENVSNFDYLDLYFKNTNDRFTNVRRFPINAFPVDIRLPFYNSKHLYVQRLQVSVSGTTLTLTNNGMWEWNGESSEDANNDTSDAYVVSLDRVDGVKIGHVGNDEVVDARVGDNGVTYQNLGDAIREQFSDVKNIASGNPKESMTVGWSITFGGTWNATTQSYLIPVEAGDEVVLKNNAQRTSYYTVVKSLNNQYSGGAVDFATGYNSIKTLNDITFTVPSDGKYVWIYGIANGVDYTPSVITVNGYSVFKSLRKAISENTSDVANLFKDVIDIDGDVITPMLTNYAIVSGGVWNYTSYKVAYLVPIAPNSIIHIERAGVSYYSCLKSLDNIGTGNTPDYATGYDTYKTYNTKITFTAPSDANYLWLYKSNGTSDFTPSILTVDEYPVFKNLKEAVADNLEAIADLNSKMNMINGDLITPMLTKFAIVSGGVWNQFSYDAAFLIPINPNSIIHIKKIGADYYSCLKSINNMVSGARPDYATGYDTYKAFNSEITFTAPEDANYLWLYKSDGTNDHTPNVLTVDGYPAFKNLKEVIADNLESIGEISNNIFTTMDVADGLTNELTPFDGSFVSFHTESNLTKREPICGDVVAMNHDDLQQNDYINTRKIYNKYGFNANFNLLVEPFTSGYTISEKRENIKRMIADGNDIGFHAPIGGSFWWMNKMYDVRPDGTSSFAPTLSEVKNVVADGKNVFGYEVDLIKYISAYGFVNPPSAYASTPISDLSDNDFQNIIKSYCYLFRTDTENLTSGIDVNGNTQNWTPIKWLEHWYNELIDDSLGYSVLGDVNTVYTNYETGNIGSYPDVEHILNGKMVFYDDTENENYSNSEYQKVGRFKSGIFKGAATCCNYEVRRRIIEIAKAYMKYYFGIDRFSLYGRHGIIYVDNVWELNGVPYDNRAMSVCAGEFGRTYNSILQKWETGLEVLLDYGIKMTSHHTPLRKIFVGQNGLYVGQNNYRIPFFSYADLIIYLVLAGNNSSDVAGASINTENLIKILSEQSDPLKFAYENAGNTVTSKDNTVSCFVLYGLKNSIDLIRRCSGTGKIPFLSVDTIKNNASNVYATELLCQYCYDRGITIVTPEKAREIATSRNWQYKQNYFPNSKFSSSVLQMFGGSSISNDAYRPDGWGVFAGNPINNIVEENNQIIYQVSNGGVSGTHYNCVELWGIPAGSYKFSCYAKQTGNNGIIAIKLFKNKNLVGGSDEVIYVSPQSEFEFVEREFTISESMFDAESLSAESQYNFGYGKNTVCIQILMGIESSNNSETISIYNPKITPLD